MDLITESGVGVRIVGDDETKTLAFDKPVRAIGLTKEESLRIGTMLIRRFRSGITAEVRNLIDSGFFSEKRGFGQIKSELFEKGIQPEPSSLNVILSKMVQRGELQREGERRFYKYFVKENQGE